VLVAAVSFVDDPIVTAWLRLYVPVPPLPVPRDVIVVPPGIDAEPNSVWPIIMVPVFTDETVRTVPELVA
jgi:hypothetical protein